MVIYLAALQDVPEEQHESALLDGAGFLRRIFCISLPPVSYTHLDVYKRQAWS